MPGQLRLDRQGRRPGLLHDYRLEISQGALTEKGSDFLVQPGVHGYAKYDISNKWRVFGQTDFIWWPDEWAWEARAGIAYQINSAWDIGLSGLYVYREISNSEFYNEFANFGAYLNIGYTFR